MSTTKFIIIETGSFSVKIIYYEERAKSYPYNLLNVTNPLDYNIEAGNKRFAFKEAKIKPNRLDFVKASIKEIGAHKDDQNWTIVRRRYLNGKIPQYLYGPSRGRGTHMGGLSSTHLAYVSMEELNKVEQIIGKHTIQWSTGCLPWQCLP